MYYIITGQEGKGRRREHGTNLLCVGRLSECASCAQEIWRAKQDTCLLSVSKPSRDGLNVKSWAGGWLLRVILE